MRSLLLLALFIGCTLSAGTIQVQVTYGAGCASNDPTTQSAATCDQYISGTTTENIINFNYSIGGVPDSGVVFLTPATSVKYPNRTAVDLYGVVNTLYVSSDSLTASGNLQMISPFRDTQLFDGTPGQPIEVDLRSPNNNTNFYFAKVTITGFTTGANFASVTAPMWGLVFLAVLALLY
eukprot:TRINITY_DN1677_c0_g1_i1.p1 TRINITY_DN1677_c0_g1~~TRINITY_DN1677_c0_g1_i1.p1  ORF type:complete len:192 (+),score=24.37 TRINITY_DN1677_c0_g1_i1:42-578(+)